MTQAYQDLYNEISELPLDKVSKVLSYVRYLKHEPETELFINLDEEDALHELLTSGDFVDASEVFAKIGALSND